MKRLIVGLGNPGKKYENTRHNLGFTIVSSFAKKCNWNFKKERELEGELAIGTCNQVKVVLLLPTTYMNLSGHSVKKTMDFYKISLPNLLIVNDDFALPFGAFRYRKQGSAGGHNGLKSIEFCLKTQEYSRLRVGIGDPIGPIENYVLSSFTKEEIESLPQIIDEGVQFITNWIQEIEEKVQHANEG